MQQFTFIALLSLLHIFGLQAQDVLDQYIREGVNNNSGLKQASLEFESSLEQLNEARGGLLPSIDFSSRYTKAHGGRSFVVPIGDLMNPVYSTLNSLTGEDRFSQIENSTLNFNRTTDIDNKITLTQPIFDKRLILARAIAEDQSKIKHMDVAIRKRALVAEIKKAYFNYLKSEKLMDLFTSTRKLVEENLRSGQALYNNDKVTVDVVLKAKTEIGKLDLQIAEAEKMRNNSRAYFNYLLNRSLESVIAVEEVNSTPALPSGISPTSTQREEFSQIDMGLKANDSERKLHESITLPNLYAVVDYGFQGSEYEFNNRSDYVLASVVLSWNLFSGFQNKARIQQTAINSRILESREQELAKSIELEAIQSFYDLKEKKQNFETTSTIVEEAATTYQLVNKKYQEGMSSQLELIDARTNLTNAKIQQIISKYDTWISFAAYERTIASYPIESL
ncbi:MAG: TolC family protein [Cyclobacteriaceae bacterium]